jgi:hypothetical protein
VIGRRLEPAAVRIAPSSLPSKAIAASASVSLGPAARDYVAAPAVYSPRQCTTESKSLPIVSWGWTSE